MSQPLRRSLFFAAAVLPALLGAGHAAEPTLYTLSNGLKICLVQDDSADVAAVELTLRVSADCEPPDKAGIRSLLQHCLRFGWELRLKDDPSLGFLADMTDARAGVATRTDWEYVGFGYAGTADTLEPALSFLATGVFRPAITQEAYDGAAKLLRTVTSGPQSQPGESTHALFRLALQGSVPRAYPTGTKETLAGLSQADVTAFHRRFYVPNLAAVCVVSPASAAQVRPLVEKAFGSLAAGKADLPPPPAPPDQPDARVEANTALLLTGSPDLDIASLVVGVPAPGYDDPDLPVSFVLQALLGPNPVRSGRLDRDQELWQSLGLPFSGEEARRRGLIEGLRPPLSSRSYLAVHAYASPLHLDDVRTALLRQFQGLADKPPTADEVATARQYALNVYARTLDSLPQRAQALGRAVALGAVGPLVNDFPARLAKVTPKDCQRVAQRCFSRRAEGVELPEAPYQ